MANELLGSLELNRIYQRDCLSDGGMSLIPDKSVDMILCDLPYGTTRNKWDSIIPLDALWAQYERVIKDNGAIVLTAQTPFDKMLGASNLKLLKYEWVWEKIRPTGFLNAKKMPLKQHENILVFYKKPPVYNAQGLVYSPRVNKRSEKSFGTNYGNSGTENISEYTNYPNDILKFNYDKEKFHPTQKPVALFEYLIRTYTNEGDIVLDNCMGSGTTAVAALKTGRKFIGFETEPAYIEIANKRIDNELEAK